MKKRKHYKGRQLYHIPKADCGHMHYYEAKKLSEVNCFSCIELIKTGYGHNLEKAPFLVEAQTCSCGKPWVLRTNKATLQQFLGCSGFPKCKNTNMIKLIPVTDSLNELYYNTSLLGEVYREVDGYYVFIFKEGSRSCWSEYTLRLVADALEDLNKGWDEQIKKHFELVK